MARPCNPREAFSCQGQTQSQTPRIAALESGSRAAPHTAISKTQMSPSQVLVSYRNALLHVIFRNAEQQRILWKIPDISQKSENGGNPANVHVINSEHLNQTLTRLLFLHTSPDTQIPADACRGRMLFKARSFEKRGYVPLALFCQSPWHHGGYEHTGFGRGCLPSPLLH